MERIDPDTLHFALALPSGELSPQVTERACAQGRERCFGRSLSVLAPLRHLSQRERQIGRGFTPAAFFAPQACLLTLSPTAPFLLCERNGGKNAVKGRDFRLSRPLTNPTLYRPKRGLRPPYLENPPKGRSPGGTSNRGDRNPPCVGRFKGCFQRGGNRNPPLWRTLSPISLA